MDVKCFEGLREEYIRLRNSGDSISMRMLEGLWRRKDVIVSNDSYFNNRSLNLSSESICFNIGLRFGEGGRLLKVFNNLSKGRDDQFERN